MAKQRYTAEQVSSAIVQARGFTTAAAKMLGCSRRTVERYVNRHASVAEAQQDARESMKDFAEAKLYKRIEEGSDTCLIFFLKTKCKDRGYVERQDVDLTSGGKPVGKLTMIQPNGVETN